MIDPEQRLLPDNTKHSQETDIHELSGIQTRDTINREAADPHLRHRGHCYRRGRFKLAYLISTKHVSVRFNNSKKIFWVSLIVLRVADNLATNQKGIDSKDICRSSYFDSIRHKQGKSVICLSNNILSNLENYKVLKPSATIVM